jgi:hypothetical protein
MMPHTPNALSDLFAQFRNAIITGELAAGAHSAAQTDGGRPPPPRQG